MSYIYINIKSSKDINNIVLQSALKETTNVVRGTMTSVPSLIPRHEKLVSAQGERYSTVLY